MNARCSIEISEIDDKLSVIAKIPNDMQGTIAAKLAAAMVDGAASFVSAILAERKGGWSVSGAGNHLSLGDDLKGAQTP